MTGADLHDSRDSHNSPDAPSPWVVRFAALIPPGEVLDLACGRGRHARLLADMGHPVIALDRDADALSALVNIGITPLQFDVEQALDGKVCWPFAPQRFAGIVVTNYLHRPLFGHILDSLAPGGVLIYETFAQGNQAFGKPSNADFLLERGELLQVVRAQPDLPASAGFQVVAYEDGFVPRPKPAIVQRLCAVRHGSPSLCHALF